MVKTSNLAQKEKWVAMSVATFYQDPFNLERLYDVLHHPDKSKPKLSLRLIEWFLTNYSKKNNVVYPIRRPTGSTELFLVFPSYRTMTSAYPKKLFDPCCRGDYINLEYNGTSFKTAVCQLNFFKWAFENLILEYIEANYDVINKDMLDNCSQANRNPIKKTKQQLSQSIHQQMNCNNIPIKVSIK